MGKCVAGGYTPYFEKTVCDGCLHKDVCGNSDYLTENSCSDKIECSLAHLRELLAAAKEGRPLTLDELRKMDGEPVWLKDGIGEGWFLASAVVGSKIYFCEKSITIGEPISECGKTWLAYRTKPEPPERS